MLKKIYLVIGVLIILFSLSITNSPICQSVKNNNSYNLNLNGNIWYVGGNGSGNFTKIQDAIENASDSDIVFVLNESSPYYEHVFINKSINLIGEDKDSTVINGNNIGSVITITKDNVTINGFTIEKSGDDYFNRDSGIFLLSDDNKITDNNLIINQYGIFFLSGKRNIIINNTINYNEYGICLYDSSTENFISGNTLESWTFDFNIYIRKNCNNNTIFNNILTNYDGHGIYIYESDDNNISKNTIIDCEIGISLYQSNSSVITNNYFQNEEDGLFISQSTRNIVSENIFVDDGLFIYDSFNNEVTNNIVNGKPLIYLENISNKTISDNPGQILLINCENIIIQGKNIINTNIAIELWGSNNCFISENNLSWNRRDIYLHDSDFNVIKDNEIKIDKGIIFMQTLALKNCIGNKIIGNDFLINHDYTYIKLEKSQENLISKNTITSIPEEIAVRLILTKANNNTVEKNIFNSAAISLSISHYNTIDNNIFNCGCIQIHWSMGNKISDNQITANFDVCGIPMEGSFENIICRNTIEDCNGAFLLTDSLRNVIKKNNIINCGNIPALFSNSLRNKWWRNYWGHPMLRPKIIPGEIRISRYYKPDLVIPVFNVDLFPKQIPYIL